MWPTDHCHGCLKRFKEGERAFFVGLVTVTYTGAEAVIRDGKCCLPKGHNGICVPRQWALRPSDCGEPGKVAIEPSPRVPKAGKVRVKHLSGGIRVGYHQACFRSLQDRLPW